MTADDLAYRPRTKNQQFVIVLVAAFAAAVLGVFTLGGIVLVFIGLAIFQRRKATRLTLRMDDAARRLAAGELDEPARELDDVARHARFLPALHSAAVFHRAVAFMRSGDFDRSATLLETVYTTGWLESPRLNLAGHSAAMRAACEALRGDIVNARVWLEKARPRKGVLVLPEVLIALRDGRNDEAAAIIEKGWPDAEAVNGASSMRALRVLLGYAFARSVTPASNETVGMMVNAARPFRTGELDYLSTAWPDLDDFLVRHGFRQPKVMMPLEP